MTTSRSPLREMSDIDNDSLIFILDAMISTFTCNESANGATLILNDNSLATSPTLPMLTLGLDNFSYYVIDNYSVPSNTPMFG